MISTDMYFIDSNILLYLTDKDEQKSLIVKRLLLLRPCINSQVLVEVLNVCRRKYQYSKLNLVQLWESILIDCTMLAITRQTHVRAIELVKRYQFQLFDSIMVASALEADCDVLYSEDMQHTLVVENRLTIVNPFS